MLFGSRLFAGYLIDNNPTLCSLGMDNAKVYTASDYDGSVLYDRSFTDDELNYIAGDRILITVSLLHRTLLGDEDNSAGSTLINGCARSLALTTARLHLS